MWFRWGALVAFKSGVDPHVITFHGNNKSRQELQEAIDAGIELIAVDNLYELDLLEELTTGRAQPVPFCCVSILESMSIHTTRSQPECSIPSSGFHCGPTMRQTGVARALEIPGIVLKASTVTSGRSSSMSARPSWRSRGSSHSPPK